MAKSRKIEGLAEIIDTGSACIPMMGFETPYVRFDFIGEELMWWSDRVDDKHCGTYLKPGMKVWIRGFIREATGRLFNVRISQICNS